MPHFFTHLYCAEAVSHNLNFDDDGRGLFRVGNEINDLDLSRDICRIHGRSDEFYKTLPQINPLYAPLGLGMINHDLIDDEYHKYIIEKEKDVEEIIKNHQEIKGILAHNVAEFAVDYLIVVNNSVIKDVLRGVEVNFDDVANCVSQFFPVDETLVEKLLNDYYDIMCGSDFSSPKNIEDTFNKHFPETHAKIGEYFYKVVPLFQEDSLLKLGEAISKTSDILYDKVEKYKNEVVF